MKPGKPRGMPKWARIGAATAFGPTPGGSEIQVGWLWEIRRDGSETRQIRVEVSRGPFVVTDLPAGARNAIRSRGATAVDAYLNQDEPPARIVVSTLGVHADPAG